ncbi:MAG: lysophospholipid acyltransferase family protein [Verrucomicrobiae bacterium]|nr:lysophospholipid acyltransferase family protein [Verrucomicrobiae bacterium]
MFLWYRFWALVFRLFYRWYFWGKVYNVERIPKKGGVLLCMNHQSYIDPPLAGAVCEPRRVIWYLARKTLWNNKVMGKLLDWVNAFPVDQDRPDMASLKKVIRLLNEEKGVLIFPEGSRTADGNLQPGAPGAGLVVAKTGKPVVPARIFGAYEAYPLGGKMRRHPVIIKFGHPIDFSDMIREGGKDKELYKKIADRIMEEISKLEPRPD